MAKLKRRDFMKMLGAAAITPVALLRAKPITHPVDVLIDLGMPNGKLMVEMREWCDEPVYKAESFLNNFDTLELEITFPKGEWHHFVADIP